MSDRTRLMEVRELPTLGLCVLICVVTAVAQRERYRVGWRRRKRN